MANRRSSSRALATVLGSDNPFSVERLREQRTARGLTRGAGTISTTKREKKILAKTREDLLAEQLTALKGAVAVAEVEALEKHALGCHARLSVFTARSLRATRRHIGDPDIRELHTIFALEVVNRGGSAMATVVDITGAALADIVERPLSLDEEEQPWQTRLSRGRP